MVGKLRITGGGLVEMYLGIGKHLGVGGRESWEQIKKQSEL